MATLTNTARNTATLSNRAVHSATLANVAKKGRFGDIAMSVLATDAISRWAGITFDTPITRLTNVTKN